MRNIFLLSTALVLLLVAGACKQETPQKNETGVTEGDVRRQTKEALETTGEYLRQKKDQYTAEAERDLDELQKKTDDLQTKAKELSSEARKKMDAEVDELRKKEQAAREKLGMLKEASAEKWEEFKTDMDAALQDIRESYSKVVSHFKE